ncbi:DUF3826 domain-containing protein [Zunongwangia sp. HGR-M22]|uniref:DUF3826 domain-containing protein n=1 Tax=Zunongwangia sp. HGR-M22 TaxID=3015168 RepID=UPI0022DE6CD6|nr:DUF3826 domain-containing protein [Zunongwangia sp. HGR-M22]WBL24705.1 DUF3826 domain-containing protein [Zunongwangia sp. HGR-M22]
MSESDRDQYSRASKWVSDLNIMDSSKTEKVRTLIFEHLKTIRDYHNSHSYTIVPEGINPKTGDKLSDLDRRIIAHSAQPADIHENFISSLRKELTEEQVVKILDYHTVGKVDFTMKAYKEIVPDLSTGEIKHIRGLLEEARERAIDFKNMEEISAIFEIYKTKAEAYLNSNGRDWRQLYKDYVHKNN